jgi:hypothetical protein
MGTLRGFGTKLLHAFVLGATGWLLLATSAEPIPDRECFDEVGEPATMRITLGLESSAGGAGSGGDGSGAQAGSGTSSAGTANLSSTASTIGSSVASCNGVDGLRDGSELTLSFEPAENEEWGGDCHGYKTIEIQGIAGLTLRSSPNQGDALTTLSGSFLSPSAVACRGNWRASLEPTELPKEGLSSPIEAGKSERWRFRREIWIEQAHFCDGTFSQRGDLHCVDEFNVTQAEEVTP